MNEQHKHLFPEFGRATKTVLLTKAECKRTGLENLLRSVLERIFDSYVDLNLRIKFHRSKVEFIFDSKEEVLRINVIGPSGINWDHMSFNWSEDAFMYIRSLHLDYPAIARLEKLLNKSFLDYHANEMRLSKELCAKHANEILETL